MRKRSKIILISLSLLSGVILALGWPEKGFPGLLFIGLVPLLFMEDAISQNHERFVSFSVLFYSWPGFLAWNALTTWWIYNSTGIGSLLAIILNSLFMAIIFEAFHFSKKKFKSTYYGYICLVLYWISFEFLHLNWDLNWPWLNLGNGFAHYYTWVQWYEYTGALGGTLWILISNILVFELVKALPVRAFSSFLPKRETLSPKWLIPALIVWIGFPLIFSIIRYNSYKEKKDPVSVVVVQPNLDPYTEQYSVPPNQVISRIMNLAAPELDSNVQFLVTPESAIQEDMWENDLQSFLSVQLLKDIAGKYPDLNMILGGSTFRMFKPGEKLTHSARKFRNGDGYYDAYNAAIMINSLPGLQLYHKSKLTPGVESMPSFGIFKFIEKYAINLGGTVGSLGTDDIRRVYKTVKAPPASAVICYESTFGEFFSRFVRNGAQVMFIITNDGWWGNTPGYRQHFSFASLRAIENRRSIARSANTGISAFINQRGDPIQKTPYWVPVALKGTINANSGLTFYTRHGDYIARAAVLTGLPLLLISFFLPGEKRKKLKTSFRNGKNNKHI
ncbi:MAG: apolipoprotein N-acyltransferase [Bacteroidota bacterium]|nr:apolipoprotein N-acyltransferase [Bacteroidota bacterium]